MAEKNPQEDRTWVRSLALFSIVVTEIVGCTAVGGGIGWYLMTRHGWPMIVPVFLAMAGMGLAFYHIYLVSQRLESKK